MEPRHVCTALLALLCVAKLEARAQIAIESYEGTRPAGAGPFIERMRRAFAFRAVKSSSQHVRSLLRHVAQPGVSNASLTYADFVERSDKAFKAFMHGMPEGLPARRRELEGLIAESYANPAIVAVADGSRELMTRTYAALALCQIRLNDKPSAFAVLAEQMRSYPELPFTRDMFGSELTDHYNNVRATESMKSLGALVVEANQPRAQIYINESPRGQNGRYRGNALAGTYRVMIRVGATSLRYEISIEGGKATTLELDWNLETALTASSEWVGLTLSSDDPDAEELAHVHALARKMTGSSSLVVLNVATNGRQASAALYERLAIENGKAMGTMTRRGRVDLKGEDDDKRLDALALFVTTGSPSPDVVDTSSVRRGAKFAPKPLPLPPPPKQPVVQPPRDILPVVLIGAGAVAMLAGSTLYALDEDATTAPTPDRKYRNLAPYGLTVGAIGLASIGIGVVLRRRSARLNPTIALGPSSAMIGWASSF